jgi:hypothetical protein
MRLSEWLAVAPRPEVVGPKVVRVVETVLSSLGTEADPHVWVIWGDDPSRFAILAPTPTGLIAAYARANVPGEGPRATAKVIRWPKLIVGELAVETKGGNRHLGFQVDQHVLQGVDEEADAIGRFALVVLAAIDGRPWPPFDRPPASAG